MPENEGNPIIDARFLGDVPTSRVDRYGRLPLYLGPGQTLRGDGVGDLPAFTADTPNVGDTLIWNGTAYVPQAPAKGATIYANLAALYVEAKWPETEEIVAIKELFPSQS